MFEFLICGGLVYSNNMSHMSLMSLMSLMRLMRLSKGRSPKGDLPLEISLWRASWASWGSWGSWGSCGSYCYYTLGPRRSGIRTSGIYSKYSKSFEHVFILSKFEGPRYYFRTKSFETISLLREKANSNFAQKWDSLEGIGPFCEICPPTFPFHSKSFQLYWVL